MNWSIDQHFKLVANYATGFKVPSLYQLYGEFGNKLLKPEQTKSFEMGLKWNQKNNAAKESKKHDIKPPGFPKGVIDGKGIMQDFIRVNFARVNDFYRKPN